MSGREHADRLLRSLLELGPRRLAALAVAGVTVFAVVVLGGFYLSRPQLDVLYSGLDREDVTRIGAALNEAGIGFDVNADGTAVLVSYGETAAARMLLAEKGLPQSANAGYELFDQLGSLGLTSFMQEVTRVRALEGEIARTIQSLKGVKAARVHIVAANEGSFRRARQPPSASVVIRTERREDANAAEAIRHLVAAAVPGMTSNEVTVLNTDGVLLASGGDTEGAAPGRLMGLEQTVGNGIRDRVREALTPYLGLDNFQVSVTAALNTDKTQTTETVFDPDSRVERSVRVVRENEASNNSTRQVATSVETDLPDDGGSSESGENASASQDRREEVTNYELSSKTITTVSDGFTIRNLSIAVLVNRARLAADGEGRGASEDLAPRLAEIEQLVATAAGVRLDRGDQVKVVAVEFVADARELEPAPGVGMTELLVQQSSTFVNAATILFVTFLMIWFGLRPATRAILSRPATQGEREHGAQLTASEAATEEGMPSIAAAEPAEISLIDDLTSQVRRSPRKKLEQMVRYNDEQSAAILKQWLHQGARS